VKLDVEDVLRRLGIEGKQAGDHIVALCPFHDDSSPSWRIRRRGAKKGLHHCQACKEGGDVVSLVMHLKGYGTREGATAWLTREGQEVTEADLQIEPVRLVVGDHVRREFRMPPGFEGAGKMVDWPDAVAEYAASRGMSAAQVARWSVGYALEGRLKGRLVVPIRDARGAPRSYVGRTFVGAERRYLYPREEEKPDMGAMFGEEHWPPPEKRLLVVVTEGALKGLAVERAFPIPHAAVGGSGLRLQHLAKLATFRIVVVMTDEDEAGRNLRDELAGSLARRVGVQHVRLPEGQDADSMSREALRGKLGPALG
jgi:DNA primase